MPSPTQDLVPFLLSEHRVDNNPFFELSCSTSLWAGDGRGPATHSRNLVEPLKMHSGRFLTILILVCVLVLHYSNLSVLLLDKCPVPHSHVHTPSALCFLTPGKLWLLRVAQLPPVAAQRQSLYSHLFLAAPGQVAVRWSRVGPGPVLAWAGCFHECLADSVTCIVAAVVCSRLPAVAVPGPSPACTSHACLNV